VKIGTIRAPAVRDSALFLAWMIALASTLGALFIGEVMGQPPCLLCWYQRIAMFPLAVILGVGCYFGDMGVRRYVLPVAVLGAVVALWHSLLYAGVVPEAVQPCTRDGPSCAGQDQIILGVLPLPFLSLVAFSAIVLLMTIPYKKASP